MGKVIPFPTDRVDLSYKQTPECQIIYVDFVNRKKVGHVVEKRRKLNWKATKAKGG